MVMVLVEYLNLRYYLFMRLISDTPLRAFCASHPEAKDAIWAFRSIILKGSFANFAELKAAFNATDKVGEFCVFDIGGNKYRLIAKIEFKLQILFVREVFTHKEYDKWKP
jgi:mRNA interferase HigB